MSDSFFPRVTPFFKVVSLVACAGAFCLLANPAQAGFQAVGFQWVEPPAGGPSSNAQPSSGAMPPPGSPDSFAPVSGAMPTPVTAMPIAAPPSATAVPTPPSSDSQSPEVISPIVIDGGQASSAGSVSMGSAGVGGSAMAAGETVSLQPPPSWQGKDAIPSVSPSPPVVMPPGAQPGRNLLLPNDSIVQGFANNVPLAVALREILPPGYGFSIDQDVDLGTVVSFEGGKPWRETLVGMLQPAGLDMREEGVMVSIGRVQSPAVAMNQPVINSAPAYASASAPVNAPAVNAPASSAMPLVNAPMPQPAANNTQAAMAPAPYMPPAPAKNAPLWNGTRPSEYRPILTQPSQPILPAPPPPPLVSSLHAPPPPTVDTWTAARGDTLHAVLDAWSRRAHAEFQWSAEYDYPLQASISFTGTFEDAVRSLLSGFEEAHPQPVAELHDNHDAGQMILVVQTRGNSYTD